MTMPAWTDGRPLAPGILPLGAYRRDGGSRGCSTGWASLVLVLDAFRMSAAGKMLPPVRVGSRLPPKSSTGNLRSRTSCTRTLARATPGPGAAEIDAVARAAEVAVAAVQDDVPGGRVVGHRRALPGGWVGRGGLLGPGRAIPGPGVTEIAFKDAAAEQDDVPGGRVVGHRRKFSGGRAGRGRLLGPGR